MWRGPPAHHRSHLGKPVPDHLETACPPITVLPARVTYPFLVASHTLVSAQESTTPPPSATAASPLPRSTLVVSPSPPLLADCALRLAAAARCQDLFRERAGAGWAGEEEEEGERAHTGASGAHLSTPTLPNSLVHTCLPFP